MQTKNRSQALESVILTNNKLVMKKLASTMLVPPTLRQELNLIESHSF